MIQRIGKVSSVQQYDLFQHAFSFRTRRLLEFLSTDWKNIPSAMEARTAKTDPPAEWPHWKPRMLVDCL